jgi:cytochrome b561
MIKNSSTAYGSVAKFFHWVVGVLIIGMLIFGYFLDDFSKDMQPLIYNIHKLTGLTILTLMLLRWGWRAINPKPSLAQDVPFWQRRAERLVHHLMYFFVLLMPVAGWVGSSAAGHPPHLGDYSLGLPIEKSETIDNIAFWFHNNIALVLIALISVHVLAALYHYFIKRDDIMQRML